MANTYTLIASNTVGSGGVSSVSFSSIASTYTDLLIKISSRATAVTVTAKISFNGVTTNLTSRQIYGDGSAASSLSSASVIESYGTTNASSYTANAFASADIYIPNYTSSNYKSVSVDSVTESNQTDTLMAMAAGLWSATNAITSITLTPNSGNFAQYSTFYLYGIKNS